MSINSFSQLHESSSRPLAAFIGSGLSIPEPTSLPSSKEAVLSILNLDWVNGNERFPISESQIEESNLSKIRLEHLLSIFKEWGKHEIAYLLQQFADSPPNWYHYRIADLCREKRIRSIITTNFDLCLEKALSECRVAYRVVVNDDDDSDEVDTLPILKIHGTLEHGDNGYRSQGLGSTLESVYNGLDPWKREYLMKLLHKYTFVFLGYSGSDSFDINPILLELPTTSLFWVAHESDRDRTSISPEVFAILRSSQYPYPLITDTASFLGGRPLDTRTNRFKFKPTYNNLQSHFHPSVFLGRVFEAVENYVRAREYYENVLEHSLWDDYFPTEEVNVIRSKAVALYELGEFKKALTALFHAEMCLAYCADYMESQKSVPTTTQYGIILDQWLLLYEERALVYAALGRKKEAIENMEMAFKCLDVLENNVYNQVTALSFRSRLLLNQNIIRFDCLTKSKDLDDSELLIILEDLKTACEMKRHVGDVVGLVKGLAMLGNIYITLGELQSAEAVCLVLFDEVRKLQTPTLQRPVQLATKLLSLSLYVRLGANLNINVGGYMRHEGNTKREFEEYVKEVSKGNISSREVHPIGNMLNDGKIQEYCRILRKEIQG